MDEVQPACRESAGGPHGAELSEVGSDRSSDFAATACAGYGHAPEFVPWLEAVPGRERWVCVVAYEDKRPVGNGALAVDGDTGWLSFGATLPEARGRGSQSAILAYRIHRAAELGCTVLITETGERTGDRPSALYRNILRAGFEEVYLRPNFRAP
jgi:GNAT superfamily N-acetyltransferase